MQNYIYEVNLTANAFEENAQGLRAIPGLPAASSEEIGTRRRNKAGVIAINTLLFGGALLQAGFHMKRVDQAFSTLSRTKGGISAALDANPVNSFYASNENYSLSIPMQLNDAWLHLFQPYLLL